MYFLQLLYQKYIKYKYNVLFGKNCKINRNNLYEGFNSLFNNVRFSNSFIGKGSYIASHSDIRFTKIGRFCAIGNNVRTYLGQHPTKDFVSIHPAFFSKNKQAGFSFADKNYFEEHKYINDKYVVEIGNDVWIGNNVNILDGVKIGNGAVISAGALVREDVPDYAIVGGLPAKVIKYRFNPKEIEYLLNFKWWDKDFDWLKNNYQNFHSIENFINKTN